MGKQTPRSIHTKQIQALRLAYPQIKGVGMVTINADWSACPILRGSKRSGEASWGMNRNFA